MYEKSPETPTVVTITDRQDAHVPFVERHLEMDLVVIDPTTISEGTELSYSFSDNQLVVSYQGETLNNVAGVWYRKPRPLTEEMTPVGEIYKEYSLDALKRHTEVLRTQFDDAVWVSDYYNIMRASSKTLQYQTAARLGFKIPDTLLTSNATAAQQFVAEYSATVVKTLSNHYPKDESGAQRMFLTQRTNSSMSYSGLEVAPAIFQEAIDVGAELRVTVVGDKVFPAVISDTTNDTSVRDWRIAHFNGGLQIDAFDELPQDIAEACIAHSKLLGLNFSAIDLIIDKKGEIWFLENNPNGQWGFVEEATGQPIGQAMADLLSSRRR